MDNPLIIVLIIFLTVYIYIPLIFWVKNRTSYELTQRNVPLVLAGMFSNGTYAIFELFVKFGIVTLPCSVEMWISNILIAINVSTMAARGIRLIFLNRLNIYKISQSKKLIKYQNENDANMWEPNIYYRSLYKIVNKRVATRFVLFPIFIMIVVSVIITICFNDSLAKTCSEIQSFGMFAPVMILTLIYDVISPVIVIELFKVKDLQKFGIKSDTIMNSILYIPTTIITFVCNNPKFSYTTFKEYTKDGVILIVLANIIVHFFSVIIPLIRLYNHKLLNKKYGEVIATPSIKSFNKVIRNPFLFEELKMIAISEFCVENILFYEAYKDFNELMNQVECELTKNKLKNGDTSNKSSISNSFVSFNMEVEQIENSNCSNNQLLQKNVYVCSDKRVIVSIQSIYELFIKENGAATINISSSTREEIKTCIYTHKYTTTIFDQAVDEVIMNMFFNIYPRFLRESQYRNNDKSIAV